MPTRLLMLAGLLRDEYPWITELLLDASRDLRSGAPRGTRRAVETLQRSIGAMNRMMPLFYESQSSRDTQILMIELSSILEHAIHFINVNKAMISLPVQEDAQVGRYKSRSGQ